MASLPQGDHLSLSQEAGQPPTFCAMKRVCGGDRRIAHVFPSLHSTGGGKEGRHKSMPLPRLNLPLGARRTSNAFPPPPYFPVASGGVLPPRGCVCDFGTQNPLVSPEQQQQKLQVKHKGLKTHSKVKKGCSRWRSSYAPLPPGAFPSGYGSYLVPALSQFGY